MYLYRDHSTIMSLGEGEGVDKESNKKWHRKGGVQSKKVMTLTKFLLGFL